MALATQCPQCLTIFRVAGDQLKLRGGLVRCGSCKNVFNGNEYLVEASVSDGRYHPAPGSRALPPGTPPPAVPVPAATVAATDPVPVVNTAALERSDAAGAVPAVVTDPDPAPAALPLAPAAPATAPIPLVQEPKVFRSPDSPGYIPDLGTRQAAIDVTGVEDFPLPSKPSVASREDALPPPHERQPSSDLPEPIAVSEAASEPISETTPEPLPASDPEAAPLDEFDFVKKAQRRARMQHATRIGMLLLVAVMIPLLLLQATYYWRNQIAAGAPALRPMLNGMCVAFGCTVGVPAQIEQLSLESDELQVVPPNQNIYALSLVLRNRSAGAQAWPAIELTLNNDEEKPVVRRVLRPRDYLPATQKIEDGIGGGSEQAIRLTFELDNALVSGYRIYLFYP